MLSWHSPGQQPENLLLFAPGPYPRILIADFGLARPKAYQETFNVCGTVQYLPPEGILALDNRHLGYVGMPSDCWSAGLILFVMLSCALSIQSCFQTLNAMSFNRGSHPFDYGRDSYCSCSSSVDDDDDERLSQCSQFSYHTELETKRRIVNGEIEFTPDIWNDKPDGA